MALRLEVRLGEWRANSLGRPGARTLLPLGTTIHAQRTARLHAHGRPPAYLDFARRAMAPRASASLPWESAIGRLQLFALAYNLGNFLRRLALPQSVKYWSLIPMYIGTAGEVDQDRGKGRRALPVRFLPDRGSGRAQAAVPGDPGADTAVATARDGTGMTATKDKTAGEGGGDGDGLPGSTANRHPPSGSVRVTARERTAASLSEPEKRLLDPKIVIESSGKPTAVAGRSPSGKSRVEPRDRDRIVERAHGPDASGWAGVHLGHRRSREAKSRFTHKRYRCRKRS